MVNLGICVSECAQNNVAGTELLTTRLTFGDTMKSLVAADCESFILPELQGRDVQLVKLRLVSDGALKRHAHQPGEPLQPGHDLFHHSHGGLLRGDDDGGEAEVRSALRPRGERLHQRRPLRAVGAVDVDDVHFGFSFERLHHRCVPGHMTECGPGACLLCRSSRPFTLA